MAITREFLKQCSVFIKCVSFIQMYCQLHHNPKKRKKILVDVQEEQIEIKGASPGWGHSQNKEPLEPSPAPHFRNVPHPWVYLRGRSP